MNVLNLELFGLWANAEMMKILQPPSLTEVDARTELDNSL